MSEDRTSSVNGQPHPLRPGLPELPERIARLPVDERGYPVPWFVAFVDGKPDFRVVGANKRRDAVQMHRCWVCGERLGVYLTFTIGPMCVVNRVTSEPPAHTECAEFSAKACPFLTRPKMRRRENDLPAGTVDPPGIALDRNPGAVAVWTTDRFLPFQTPDRRGWLIKIGEPLQIRWYAEGRAATRAEVEASIESGYPSLLEAAEKEGPVAIAALAEARRAAVLLYPPA